MQLNKLSAAIAAAWAVSFGGAHASTELGSGNTYTDGSSAAVQKVVVGDNNTFALLSAGGSTVNEQNVVVGDENLVMGAGNIILGSGNQTPANSAIVIGNGSFTSGAGDDPLNAVLLGNSSSVQLNGVAFGYRVEARDHAAAMGAEATAGRYSVALGYKSYALFDRAIAVGSEAEASGVGALAIGAGARATGGGIAIGAGSVATAGTVGFSDGLTLRRLTGLADGFMGSDAVTVSQMTAITESMSLAINDLSQQVGFFSGRIDALELSQGGGVDSTYADAGDARTLSQANTYADAGDARTLSQANTYADAGDARTLSQANTYADAGDARTLSQANAYTRSLVDSVESKLSEGVAGVAAMPQLPAMMPGQKALAVGTGHFNGKSAVGLAFGFAPVSGVTVYGGVSGVAGGRAVFKTGASYVW
jgi:hypothetical protein